MSQKQKLGEDRSNMTRQNNKQTEMWNQMTALRFQTGEIRNVRPSFGAEEEEEVEEEEEEQPPPPPPPKEEQDPEQKVKLSNQPL